MGTNGKRQQRLLTLVSLFTGAGGLDIGLEQAGFTTLSAIDNDPDCIRTLEHNQARRLAILGRLTRVHLDGTRILCADVGVLGGADLVEAGETVHVMAGGPPCQPFSSAGRQRSVLDPRGRLFRHFVELTAEIRPWFVLFENVRGLVTARGHSGVPGEALEDVRAAFEEIGYSTTCTLLNAADYGAHQRRVRFFMMATRTGVMPSFPPPTHFQHASPEQSPWQTLGQFLEAEPEPQEADIVRPRQALAEQLAFVPSGSGLRSPGRAEPTRPGGHWGYKQGTFIADPMKPARTVTAASTQDWIRLPDGTLRRLTPRECAGLQGFPDEWEFIGSHSSRFRQIGNAVPTHFGRLIGRVLADAVEQAATVPWTQVPASLPLPPPLAGAIAYTIRDDRKNGVTRPRSPLCADEVLQS